VGGGLWGGVGLVGWEGWFARFGINSDMSWDVAAMCDLQERFLGDAIGVSRDTLLFGAPARASCSPASCVAESVGYKPSSIVTVDNIAIKMRALLTDS
jgi:hypothetical protein